MPVVSDRARAFTTDNWKGLLKRLVQMQVSDSVLESDIDWAVASDRSSKPPNKAVANILTLHGDGAGEASEMPEASRLADDDLCVPWSDPLLIRTRNQRFSANVKSATLLSNSQSMLRPVERLVSRGQDMFASRAYVHQYLKHGLDEDQFSSSFTRLEQSIFDYRAL